MYPIGFETATVQHKGGDVPCPDVLELDDRFILKLAPPGVVLDGIEIEVEENYLTVITCCNFLSTGQITKGIVIHGHYEANYKFFSTEYLFCRDCSSVL